MAVTTDKILQTSCPAILKHSSPRILQLEKVDVFLTLHTPGEADGGMPSEYRTERVACDEDHTTFTGTLTPVFKISRIFSHSALLERAVSSMSSTMI
jgi:hypothetical protein